MQTLAEIQVATGIDRNCAGLKANTPHYRNVITIHPVN